MIDLKIKSLGFLIVLLICISSSNYRASAQNRPVVLSMEQAQEDISWLRFAIEYTHPRLYKYEDKKAVDARFDSLNKEIAGQISGLDLLARISKLTASVRCGHLYTIPQEELAEEILNALLLPFHVKVLEEKLYLINSCSPSVPNGSQILSINGKSSEQILQAVQAGITADGKIQTRKTRLMERNIFPLFYGFDLYYYLHVDRSKEFHLEYLSHPSGKRKTAALKAITRKQRAKLLQEKYGLDEKAWFKTASPRFTMDDSNMYATLTVSRSFNDKTIDPDFDSLLHSAFSTLKKRNIKHLILDLRNNEGGSEHHQMELISYLHNQPFKLYQNIYLSHLDFSALKPIILERDTAQLVFNNEDEYMRKLNENLWINNYDYDKNLQLQPPKPNVFEGKLYVLMNGTCFSSTADLIADLKRTTSAVFIGEESGGTFEGPTGGDNIVIGLPNSKIMVRISPNIQIGYLYQKHPIGRGVLPNYSITYTIDDIIAGKDLEMERAKALISAQK
jgi:hypothetical protein